MMKTVLLFLVLLCLATADLLPKGRLFNRIQKPQKAKEKIICNCPNLSPRVCPDGVNEQIPSCGYNATLGECQETWSPPQCPPACPCPDLIKECPGGGTSSPQCYYSLTADQCTIRWTPCPIPICNCPNIPPPTLCPDGVHYSSTSCSYNTATQQCQTVATPCPHPVACACPDIIRVCPGGVGTSRPICGANAEGVCTITWTPCPADNSTASPESP